MTCIVEEDDSKYTKADCIRFHRLSRKSISSIWKYVNYHSIIDSLCESLITVSRINIVVVIAQKLKIWIGEYYVSSFLWQSSYHGKERDRCTFHEELCSGDTITKIPTKYEWADTKKFLFHSFIIIIDCKRTSWILIFMFLSKIKVNEYLTMKNVVTVYDYQTWLSIKPRIIFQVFSFFLGLSSYYLLILIFTHTFLSDWENNVQIYEGILL